MSNKGLDAKNEEKDAADADGQDEEDDDELDDSALMSDWGGENIQDDWLQERPQRCWNVLQLHDCPEDGAFPLMAVPCVKGAPWPRQVAEGFYIHCLLHKQKCIVEPESSTGIEKWFLQGFEGCFFF